MMYVAQHRVRRWIKEAQIDEDHIGWIRLGRRPLAVSSDETQHLCTRLPRSPSHPRTQPSYFEHSDGPSWRNISFARQQQQQQQHVVLCSSWRTLIEHFVCRLWLCYHWKYPHTGNGAWEKKKQLTKALMEHS